MSILNTGIISTECAKGDVTLIPKSGPANYIETYLIPRLNAHYLNSPMEFNKNGYTCSLDATKHDEMEKKVGVIMLIM